MSERETEQVLDGVLPAAALGGGEQPDQALFVGSPTVSRRLNWLRPPQDCIGPASRSTRHRGLLAVVGQARHGPGRAVSWFCHELTAVAQP